MHRVVRLSILSSNTVTPCVVFLRSAGRCFVVSCFLFYCLRTLTPLALFILCIELVIVKPDLRTKVLCSFSFW